jgi:predicted acylesterase/phospholipase RssA
MSKPCDKFVPITDCKPSNVNSPSSFVCRTNPLAQDVEHLCLASDNSESDYSMPSSLSPHNLCILPPRRLALCGGAIRCIAHIGVLKELSKYNLLSCVKEMFGVSAGALFSLLYIIGYSLNEMEKIAIEFDFSMLQSIDLDLAFDFVSTMGVDSGERLERFVGSVLKTKGLSPNITFEELAKERPSIKLRCYATDVEKGEYREFNSSLTPKLMVRTALRASMSLPFLYTPVKDPETGRLLMDGSILHNLPLAFLSEHEKENTLAILFVTKSSKSSHDVFSIFQNVYDSLLLMRNKIFVEKYKDKILCVPTDDFSGLKYEKTHEEKKKFIESAQKATHEFLFKKRKGPLRRYSAA